MVREKDRFGELVGDALRENVARSRLPADFARRLVIRCARRPHSEPSACRMPRWLKIAASVAALASFAAFAAVVGVTLGRAGLGAAERGPSPAPSADPETDAISRQGENTMIARKMVTLVGAAMVSVAVPAETIESEPTFVFLRPETSSFWNTATNGTMTVPIDFPEGATSATLEVSGLDYQCVYKNITADEYAFELPAATSPETENVYDLTLSFNDTAQTVRMAKLGLVQGLSPDAEGTTRCLAPVGAKVWQKVKGRAVLPIPYGTSSFTVNGVETETGLGGAQGWYAIDGLSFGNDVSLALMANGVQYAASLIGGPGGLLLIVK